MDAMKTRGKSIIKPQAYKMTKEIAFAFPSSKGAVGFGRGDSGCYYISATIFYEDGRVETHVHPGAMDKSFIARDDSALVRLFLSLDGSIDKQFFAIAWKRGNGANEAEIEKDLTKGEQNAGKKAPSFTHTYKIEVVELITSHALVRATTTEQALEKADAGEWESIEVQNYRERECEIRDLMPDRQRKD